MRQGIHQRFHLGWLGVPFSGARWAGLLNPQRRVVADFVVSREEIRVEGSERVDDVASGAPGSGHGDAVHEPLYLRPSQLIHSLMA